MKDTEVTSADPASIEPGLRRLALGLAAAGVTAALLTAAAWLGRAWRVAGADWTLAALIALAGLIALAALASGLEASLAPPQDAATGRASQLALVTGLTLLAIWIGAVALPAAHPAPMRLAGAAILAGGAALRARAIARLGARFNSGNEVTKGSALETAGLYRRLAHPSELGLMGLAIGAVMMCGGQWELLLVAGLFGLTTTRLRLEERALARTHGPAYRRYRRATWDPFPSLLRGERRMIIFGTRGVTLNKGQPAQFFCPGCNGQRTYQRKKVQRFFTLYFIPLIPLDVLQEYVACQTCRQNYKPIVLESDPTAQRQAQTAQLNENYKALLVHFARLSGRKDRAYVDRVAEIYRSFNNDELTGDQAVAEIERPALNIMPATERLAPALNDRGREAVVTALVEVAGPLNEGKQALLGEVVKTLGMTEAHYRGVLAGTPVPA